MCTEYQNPFGLSRNYRRCFKGEYFLLRQRTNFGFDSWQSIKSWVRVFYTVFLVKCIFHFILAHISTTRVCSNINTYNIIVLNCEIYQYLHYWSYQRIVSGKWRRNFYRCCWCCNYEFDSSGGRRQKLQNTWWSGIIIPNSAKTSIPPSGNGHSSSLNSVDLYSVENDPCPAIK